MIRGKLRRMARRSTFPIYDRVLDGRLEGLLRAWRTDGLSYVEIAWKLRSEHGIEVAPETVRRWITTQLEEAAP